MGLNAVRVLSLISLILVFSSTILVMVTNIKAVNTFQAEKGSDNSTMLDCDYIMCVAILCSSYFEANFSLLVILGEALFLISLLVYSGLLSPAF